MNENRRQVLEMLSKGQITADEAERLIAALEQEQASGFPGNGSESRPKFKAKYLRVLVESEDHDQGEGPTKANIRIPMQLLRAGVKLASLIPVPVRAEVNDALRKQGMSVDLNQIKPENLEEIVDQLNELTVDLDHVDVGKNKVRVKVFCE